MNDLDEVLARLGRAPVPTALDQLEARVLARIAPRPVARADLGIGAIMVAALGIGMVGAFVPASAGSAAPVSALGADASLAPSTLLDGTP